MIVVDTNIVAYAMIEGEKTLFARRLREKESRWRLPSLWRHEFLNVLSAYGRENRIAIPQLETLWGLAVSHFAAGESPVDMEKALKLAVQHRISAYDAQFVALAQTLNIPCITEDRRLQKTFPSTVRSMSEFLNSHES